MSSTVAGSDSDDLIMLIRPIHPTAFFDTTDLLQALTEWNTDSQMPVALRLHL